MKKLIVTLLVFVGLTAGISAQEGCLPEGIIFKSQEMIDAFPLNFPGCQTILGNVLIEGNGITNLNGLSQITRIEGILRMDCDNLQTLTGLNSVDYLGGLDMHLIYCYILNGLSSLDTVGGNLHIQGMQLNNFSGLESLDYIGGDFSLKWNALKTLHGLESLEFIDGDFLLYYNSLLPDFSAMSNLTGINGQLIIADNGSLTSLEGLENIYPGTLDGIIIHNNSQLSECNIWPICAFLESPIAAVEIYSNGPGCNNPSDIADSCGFSLQCLPYGNYYLEHQSDVDNFAFDYPGCTELNGNLTIRSQDITNLQGLSGITAVKGHLSIMRNLKLTNMQGLGTLQTIGGNFHVGYYGEGNPVLANFIGLENLTRVGGSWQVFENDSLVNFEGLESLSSTGDVNIVANHALTSLQGLNNLDSIRGELELIQLPLLADLSALISLKHIEEQLYMRGSHSLTTLHGFDSIGAGTIESISIFNNSQLTQCNIKSICDYLAAPDAFVYISQNAPGCNTVAQVEEACLLGVEEVRKLSSLTIYPVPADDYIRIESPDQITGRLSVINSSGTEVMSLQVSSTNAVLDISKLPKGLYLIMLTSDDEVRLGRFVK